MDKVFSREELETIRREFRHTMTSMSPDEPIYIAAQRVERAASDALADFDHTYRLTMEFIGELERPGISTREVFSSSTVLWAINTELNVRTSAFLQDCALVIRRQHEYKNRLKDLALPK